MALRALALLALVLLAVVRAGSGPAAGAEPLQAHEQRGGTAAEELPGPLAGDADATEGGAEAPEDERRESEASRVNIVIACMLLGGIIFALSIFNLVGHPDPDIRLHAWMVLSFTTSIFTAVLTFQSLTSLLHGFLESAFGSHGNEGLMLGLGVVVKLLEALGWYFALQAVTWKYITGIPDKLEEGTERDKVLHRNATAWCTLLTHISAFSAISACRDMQSLLMLSGAPGVLTFVPVWVSVVACFGLFRVADYVRSRMEVSGEAHEKWDCVVEEAENDFAGLMLSFLNVQAFIDCLVGPPISAYDRHGHLGLRDQPELGALFMFGLSIAFAALTVAMTSYIARRERSGYIKGGTAEDFGVRFISYAGYDPGAVYIKRWLFILQGACAMSFAWCLMFFIKWQITKLLGSGFILHSESIGQLVVLALAVSFIAFALIYVLDKIQDLDATGEIADKCARSIMEGLAVLIGFSWEQSFDQGFEVIADLTAESGVWFPILLKLIFVTVVITSLVPAWRTHILKAVMDLKDEVHEHRRNRDAVTTSAAVGTGISEVDNEEVSASCFCFACNGPKRREHRFR